MTITYVAILLFAVLVAGCKPSAEELAQAEALKKTYCLDHPCEGDIQPKRDQTTESAFKANGRWFVGPSEYFAGWKNAGFYWPSRTPIYTARKDFPESVEVLSGRSPDVAIDVFVGSLPAGLTEMYPEVLERAEKQYGIASRDMLRPGFERVVQISDPGGHTHNYISHSVKTPAGVPALVNCNPRDFCSMRFAWNGLTADVRFNHRHAHDWPEIYIEVLHILTLLREEVK